MTRFKVLGFNTNVDRDNISESFNVIDYVHHEVHEGKTYHLSHLELDEGAKTNLYMTVPAGCYAHLTGLVKTGAKTYINFYEGVTVTAAGTTLDSYNMNRGSTNTSRVTVYKNAAISTTNTVLQTALIQGGGTLRNYVGGEVRQNAEWILNAGTNYMLELENAITTSVDMLLSIEWYEKDINA